MTLENRVKKMENRVQASEALDREIESLLSEFSIEERAALLEEFIATHQFIGPHPSELEDN